VEEFVEPRRLPDIQTGPQPGGLLAILNRVRRAQNDDGHVTELSGTVAALEDVTPGTAGKAKIDDHHVGAAARAVFDVLDELNRLLSISEYNELPWNAVFFECGAHEADIRRIVLHEDNKDRFATAFGAVRGA
jgi:hypothetical protein